MARSSNSGGSAQRTALSLRTGAAAARPQGVQKQPPPLLQQLLALLPPPTLQLLPQPPRAGASPAAEPPGTAAPPPKGRGYPPPGRARGQQARPQQPGARRATSARPPPAPSRWLGAHFNAAGSPGARGRLAPRPLPMPSALSAWGPPPGPPCFVWWPRHRHSLPHVTNPRSGRQDSPSPELQGMPAGCNGRAVSLGSPDVPKWERAYVCFNCRTPLSVGLPTSGTKRGSGQLFHLLLVHFGV